MTAGDSFLTEDAAASFLIEGAFLLGDSFLASGDSFAGDSLFAGETFLEAGSFSGEPGAGSWVLKADYLAETLRPVAGLDTEADSMIWSRLRAGAGII